MHALFRPPASAKVRPSENRESLMTSIRRLLLAAASGAVLVAAAPALGQTTQEAPGVQSPAPEAAGWPQATSDVPADASVRFGRLANGMRYAIKANDTPPGQAAVRLRIDAGSLNEADDQLGLAHFLEHMAFNGSENIPEGELMPRLERMGLAFGPDTNASTSFDQTIYQLDLPSASAETLTTVVQTMREMTGRATIADEAVERERGIVLSEERTRDTPALRALIARLNFLMPGQLVTERFPIGSAEIIRSAPPQRIRDFYRDYYRPQRATFVAVGDFDVDAVEALIRDTFGDWTNPAADGPEPDLGQVTAREPAAAIFVDAGAQPIIQIAWTSAPDLDPDTLEERRQNLIRSLGFAVLNRRFQRIARGAEAPFIAASSGRSTDLDSADVANVIASVRPGEWREALTALEQEQRRLVEHGVTEAELQREITDLRARYQTYVAGAETRRTPGLADAIVNSVNEEAVYAAPQTELAIFDSVVDGLTAAEVSAAVAAGFEGAGPLVFITSPTALDVDEAGVIQALEASRAETVAPPVAEAAMTWPYDNFGEPGAVAERQDLADLGATLVTFDNGVRLNIKSTDFRADQILISVRAGDGFLGLPSDRVTPIWAAGTVVPEGGLGQLTAEQMEQVLSGKVYGASFTPGEDAYLFTAATRPEDFGVQMQVLTAYLTDPGLRPEPFARIRQAYLQALPQLAATPAGVFGRESGALLRSGDARWAFPSAEQLSSATAEALAAQLTAALARGPVEVTVVGDVDVDQAIDQVSRTFGALPARPAAETGRNAQVDFPAGGEPVRLTHSGRADQGLGFVAWPTDDAAGDVADARLVDILAAVMQLRLTEELREGQAVTYSPSADATASFTFPDYGYLGVYVEMPPEALPGFFADADRIAAQLAAEPISDDELSRARQPLLENLRRARNGNEYWLSQLGDVQSDQSRLPALRSAEADLLRATPELLQTVAQRYLTPDSAYRVQVTAEAE